MSRPPITRRDFLNGVAIGAGGIAATAMLAGCSTSTPPPAGPDADYPPLRTGLRGAPHIADIRTIGLVAGIELTPREGAVGARGYELFVDCFEQGLLTRASGDTIALSPPLIVEPRQFGEMVATIRDALGRLA